MALGDGLFGADLQDTLTIGISGVALVAAVVANVSNSMTKKADDRRAARARVNDLCVRIAELNTTIQVHRVEQNAVEGLGAYNTKVNSLVRQVVALATLARDILAQSNIKAAAVEYALLADAIALSGDPGAGALWEKAVSAATTTHDRVDLLQRQADYLFTVGDVAGGEKAYAEARRAMGPEVSPFHAGRNQQLLAMSNANIGRLDIARVQFEDARLLYEAIPESPNRTYALNTLADARRRTLGETAA